MSEETTSEEVAYALFRVWKARTYINYTYQDIVFVTRDLDVAKGELVRRYRQLGYQGPIDWMAREDKPQLRNPIPGLNEQFYIHRCPFF